MSAFVRSLHVSPVLPPVKLRALATPPETAWEAREFPGDFLDAHSELANAGQGVMDFACRVKIVRNPMRLAVCLGYDGPVRVWRDGRAIFTDLHGGNPATPDKAWGPCLGPVPEVLG